MVLHVYHFATNRAALEVKEIFLLSSKLAKSKRSGRGRHVDQPLAYTLHSGISSPPDEGHRLSKYIKVNNQFVCKGCFSVPGAGQSVPCYV